MTEDEASLIVRMGMALANEGIGPARLWDGEMNSAREVDTMETDSRVLTEAVRVSAHMFPEWELREAGLIR